ncbi:hypothetical protein D9756_007534 [Leucocoprinus leucothites]|uniref:C2H2-type domain-containing protein n=1 Tax=Leucocoprinus leucothites TaxID=201217 RepID=A0A8H5D1E1_9AGAR|nr:hypothetical protein D9756_007534 [Leucoagaricus leucothites]
MSSPSDNNRSDRRVTLPPIRDFFRDEFMHSQPPNHEPPATTLARLRMDDDGNEPSSIVPLSPGQSRFSTHMHRSTSDQFSPPSIYPSSASQQQQTFSTSLYQDHYRSVESSSASTPCSSVSAPRRSEMLSSQRPTNYSSPHSHASVSPQSQAQSRNWSMDTSSQRSHPSYTQSSYAEAREPLRRNLSPTPRLPPPPNPAGSAQVHGPDSPPALVQAVAPWVIATNLDVGQIYEDDERTPIARPFDVGPMGRSPSHVVSLGRFFDEGSQPPLGKYDCKFCGKLFNRPSSLRIHLNSHTGEKPFVCPHPDCGRSFSVLSNMRRHARVHMNNPREQEPEELNEETSSRSSPTSPSTPNISSMTQEAAPVQTLTSSSQTHYRLDSNVSASSSSSRQGRDTSFDGVQMEEMERSEKRSRQRPE